MKKLILTIAALLLLPITAAPQATVKLKQANLQHGQNTGGGFDFAGQATTLAAGGTDIVGGNELSTGDLSNWDSGFTAGGMTRAIHVEHPATGDGNAIYYRNSTVTINNTYSHQLANVANPTSGSTSTGWAGTSDIRRTVVAVKATVGGQQFYVVSAHLCPSACADASGSPFNAQRVSQAEDLVSWVNSTLTGAPVFIIGDLNMSRTRLKEPSGFQFDVFLEAGYTDMWATGITAGTATANWGDRDGNGQADMPLGLTSTRTLGAQGVDYVLTKGNVVALTSIDVPDLRATCSTALTSNGAFKECPDVVQLQDFPEDQGIRPSDHNWLTAVVTVTSSKRGHMRGRNTVRRGSLR